MAYETYQLRLDVELKDDFQLACYLNKDIAAKIVRQAIEEYVSANKGIIEANRHLIPDLKANNWK